MRRVRPTVFARRGMKRKGCPAGVGRRILIALVCLQACTTEHVFSVSVSEVRVQPVSVTLMKQESVRLSATVLDDGGGAVENADVTWTSDRPSVASVGSDGVVRAVGAGSATITASIGEVDGSASVDVLPSSSLEARPPEATFHAAVGAPRPAAVDIKVDDTDGSELRDIDAAVAYPAGASLKWAETEARDGPGKASTVTVGARTDGMAPGSYTATLNVASRALPGDALEIPLSLTVADVSVSETDGGTTLFGTGSTDQVDVGLRLRPESPVVLELTSSDPDLVAVSPSNLTFAPDQWSEARTVTVTGGPKADGFRLTNNHARIKIRVDDAASDDAYHPVPDIEVEVTVAGALGGED